MAVHRGEALGATASAPALPDRPAEGIRLKGNWRLFVACAVIFVVTVALVAKALLGAFVPSDAIEASGTIEATESDVSPKVQGRLIDLRVKDGDRVTKGQTVALLERVDPTLSLDQARANVAAASAQVDVASAAYDLQQDSYATTLAQAGEGVTIARSRLGQAGENLGIETHTASLDVDQASAQLQAARSTYDRAGIDLSRTRSLVATGDESQQAFDDAKAQYKSAAAQLQAARDGVATTRANLHTIQVRQLDVLALQEQQHQSVATLQNAEAERRLVTQRRAQLAAARAQLAQARAALGLAQDQVAKHACWLPSTDT